MLMVREREGQKRSMIDGGKWGISCVGLATHLKRGFDQMNKLGGGGSY